MAGSSSCSRALAQSSSGSGGRQFGAVVLAPFAHVLVDGSVGYIDGAIIARSVGSCGQNGGSVQLHGQHYAGPLQCDAVENQHVYREEYFTRCEVDSSQTVILPREALRVDDCVRLRHWTRWKLH